MTNVQFIEDLRRLSKIVPDIGEQMRALDLATGGLTSKPSGYADESPYMLYAIESDSVLRGKLEYSFDAERCEAQIIWLNAPGYGNDMLAEFIRRMLELMPCCTLSLTCALDRSENDVTVLTRLNFYMRHGFRAVAIDYNKTNTRLTMQKKIERNKEVFTV